MFMEDKHYFSTEKKKQVLTGGVVLDQMGYLLEAW